MREPRARAKVFHGLIGLLSVTGMRLSEALNLKLADVDLDQSVLTIRGAKFGQWRLVPIHPSASAVLADYLTRREQFFHHPVSTYVFVSRRGTRLDGGHVHRTFYTLSRSTGLRVVGARKGPRLHDFRHNSESGIIPSTASVAVGWPCHSSIAARSGA